MIFNSENMLGNESGGGEDGAERRSGKTSVGCWEHRNGKIEKPAARSGSVGEEGFDHELAYDVKVTVFEYDVNLCLCVFSLPGQVCSYLTPIPVSESCGAGLIVSVDVCYCVPVSVCDMLSLDP